MIYDPFTKIPIYKYSKPDEIRNNIAATQGIDLFQGYRNLLKSKSININNFP